jgi:FkbM family methyltransferase
MRREILTSKKNTVLIESTKENIVRHFEESQNCADIIINQINTERMYDQWLAERNDLTILDIGANVGLFTLYAKDSAKAIYSVEPTPAHFDILRELTSSYINVHPLRFALHNQDGEVDFYINDGNTTTNSINQPHGKSIKVPSRRIGTILKELNLDKVDFVKCDIEGSEITALTEDTVAEVADKIDTWFLELHATTWCPPTWTCNLQQNRNTLKNIFEKVGYNTHLMGHDSLFIFRKG